MLLIEANELPNLIKLEILERCFTGEVGRTQGASHIRRVDFTASRKLKEKTCATPLAHAIPSSESF